MIKSDNEVDLRIDASPQKAFFVHTLVRDIPLENAILDLVDNAIDGAKRVKPDGKYAGLEISIVLSPDKFWIKDNCGGISLEVAQKYAFQFGRSSDFKPMKHSIGQFGVGMKRSLFKLGNDFIVKSITETDQFSLAVNVPEWLALQEWEFRLRKLTAKRTKKSQCGTEITSTDLHDEAKEKFKQEWFLDKLRQQIRVAQEHFMRNGLIIKFNGKSIPAVPWRLKAAPGLQPYSEDFLDRIKGGKISSRIKAGIGESNPNEAGWYIFCNGRCVVERDQTAVTGWGARFQGDNGASNPKYHNQFSRFRGYAFLDCDDASILPWDSTKASLDEGSAAYRLLRGRLLAAMREIIDFLNKLDAEKDLDEREKTITPLVKSAPFAAIDSLRKSPQFKYVPRKAAGPVFENISYRRLATEVQEMKEKLGVKSNKDVGIGTFEYSYERLVDK
jgi:hypothetical protein